MYVIWEVEKKNRKKRFNVLFFRDVFHEVVFSQEEKENGKEEQKIKLSSF